MKLSSLNATAEFVCEKQFDRSKASWNWRQIGRSIVDFFAGNLDPKIHRTHSGSWHVFDPKSGQTLHFSSEQEVRIWLDQRYSL